MKLTNHKLDRIMRDHPLNPAPRKKNETMRRAAEYAAELSENDDKEHTGMKYIPRKRTVLALAAAILSITMLVSAAALGYFYRTPGGDVVDSSGTPVEGDVDSKINDHGIAIGDWGQIISATWTEAEGRASLAVWTTQDTVELRGLTAVIDGTEYPLRRAAFNLNGSYVGYVCDDVPEPAAFTLRCSSPAFETLVKFTPDEVMSESTSGGFTLFGSTVGDTVYIGVNDMEFLDSEMAQSAEIGFVYTRHDTVTDSAGNICEDSRGGTNRDDSLTTFQTYRITPGSSIVSMKTDSLFVIYSFMESCRNGTAPSVPVPVPADGETVTGDWILLDCNGFMYVINSVRREGNTLHLTSDDGIVYSGDRVLYDEYAGNYLYVGVSGEGMMSSGGDEFAWEMEFDEGEMETLMNDSGELDLAVFEMRICYAGEWELNFD